MTPAAILSATVCDVAVFNTTLTAAQVAGLFNSAYGGVIEEPAATVYYVAGTASATISADVEGPSIQWYKGTYPTGTPVANSSTISGANTAILTFTPPGSGDFASYYVVVGNGTTIAGSTLTQNSTAVNLVELSATGPFDLAVLGLNPIAYWPLNEPSGSTVYNYSTTYGAALNGVLQQNLAAPACPNFQGAAGPPFLGFGPNNLATAFSTADGVSYVGTMNVAGGHAGTGVLINNTILDSMGSVSVSAWIMIPNGLNVGNQGYVYGQAGDSHLIDFGVSGGTDSQEWLSCGGSGSQQGGPNLADGNWHFIVETYSAVTPFPGVAYLDGKLNISNNYSAPVATTSTHWHWLFHGGHAEFQRRNLQGGSLHQHADTRPGRVPV